MENIHIYLDRCTQTKAKQVNCRTERPAVQTKRSDRTLKLAWDDVSNTQCGKYALTGQMTFSGIQILWGHFSQRLKLPRKPQPIKSVCWFCPQLHVGGMNKVALTRVFQESSCTASCMPAESLHPSSLPIRHKAPIDDGGHQKSGKHVARWACMQTDWHCCVSRIDCLTAGWVSISDHKPVSCLFALYKNHAKKINFHWKVYKRHSFPKDWHLFYYSASLSRQHLWNLAQEEAESTVPVAGQHHKDCRDN